MESNKVCKGIYSKTIISFIVVMILAVGLWQGDLQVLAAEQSPIITYPTENQVVGEGSLQFTWDSVSGVGAYSCQIWDLTTGSTLKWTNFSTSTSYKVYAGHSYKFSAAANDSEPSVVLFYVDTLATSVELSPRTLSLKVTQTGSLNATVVPSNASNKDITWTSNNEYVATVDSTGLVTGISPGNATINVSTTDGTRSSSSSVTVSADVVSVSSVSLNQTTMSLQSGQTVALMATVAPSDATNQSVTWATNNSSKATVDSNGIVTAVSAGNATITARTLDGRKTATCVVTVTGSPSQFTGISISQSALSLQAGKSGVLVASISTLTAITTTATWTSSDSSIATVGTTGMVMSILAVSPGSATITAKTADGTKTATCVVTVTSSNIVVTGVSINPTTLSLQTGKASALTPTVSPTNATNKAVTWTTSNSTIATVNSSGVVTGVSSGNATITTRTADGNKTANCVVTVASSTIGVTGVSISPTTLSLQVGKTGALTPTIAPTNATNKAVTWTTSDASVATVDANGVVTGKKAGNAVITVKTADGAKTSTCVVTVTENGATLAVTGVSLNHTTLTLQIGKTSTLTPTIAPANATNKAVTWITSNVNVATVDANGVVTAKAVGNATITAKTVDGNKTASCVVTVTAEAQQTGDLSKQSYTFESKPNPSTFTGTKAKSTNNNKQNYATRSAVVNSYLSTNDDGTISRLEYVDNGVVVEQYDAQLTYKNTTKVPMELPLFGGAYFGKYHNFIVFGQNNPSQNESIEVYKLVKYDKNWNKISDVGLASCNTTIPFGSGSLRLFEYGDILYIRTSHTMYKSPDGLNHQANLTFAVNVPETKIIYSASAVSSGSGYVSHSFNQFITVTYGKVVGLDHGDAYPRAIVLSEYKTQAGAKTFASGSDTIELMKFKGATGDNETGASVGGFETSSSSYIVTGNSVEQTANFKSLVTRNVFVMSTPISSPKAANVKWLTNYSETGKEGASTPQMVKIGNDSFIVLWQEGASVKYVTVNGTGETQSDIGTLQGSLSDCKPILIGNVVTWYATNNSAPLFYKVDVSNVSSPVEIKVASNASTMAAGAIGTTDATNTANSNVASEWATESITQAIDKGFVPSNLQSRYKQVINREEFCKMAVSWVQFSTGKDIDTLMSEKGVERNPNAFTDTNDNDILAAYALGITNGTGGGKFSPNGSFTREQAATMIQNTCKAINANVNNPANSNFADMTSASSWAKNGINYCRAKGIMQGTGNNKFSPKATYTIEQSIVTFNNIDKEKL